MSSTILNLIKDQLNPNVINQAASHYGESESGISKAISAIIPTVLGGLANNSNNSSVIDAISNPAASGLLDNIFGNSSNNAIISSILSNLFGDKIGGLVNTIANFSGISNSSSNSLLSTITGVVLGTLGKYSSENNLGESGIRSLLNDQKGVVSTLLPAGLSLANLGFGNWFASDHTNQAKTTASTSATSSTTNTNPNYDPRRSDRNDGGMSWLKWLIPLALLFLIGGYLLKKCSSENQNPPADVENVQDSTNYDNGAIDQNANAIRTLEDVDLNGTKLRAYSNGLESQLIGFLNSGNYDSADEASLKDTWYTFDNVNFKMGSSTELEEGSNVQLDNLVAILKAYPNAKIKIGGYTDKVGDEAKNKKLSQDRANFIKDWLGKAGVGSQVASAEGYGSEFATVPAEASDEERAVDRKMAIRFTK